MTDNTPILFKAEGNSQIGAGHLMRCFALAQFCKANGCLPIFSMPFCPANFKHMLQEEELEFVISDIETGSLQDAKNLAQLAGDRGAQWVVCDSYRFRSNYQRALKDAGLKTLFIDDNGHADYYWADIVLNQNEHATAELYAAKSSTTRLLLGAQHMLLREEFNRFREKTKREFPENALNILISMGGADVNNLTPAVLQSIATIPSSNFNIKVVDGNLRKNQLNLKCISPLNGNHIDVIRNAQNMAELMAWADVAVATAGTTAWEMAFMGLPAVLITAADNQIPVAKYLDQAGAAVSLGWHTDIDLPDIAAALKKLVASRPDRIHMSENGQRIVDGRGCARVFTHMTADMIRLRDVSSEDCRLIWEWAVDASVRSFSFNTSAIPWHKHQRWFREKISNGNCMYYLAENHKGIPLAQVRYDTDGTNADISICVAPESRGIGLGSRIIRQSAGRLFNETAVTQIHAFVKPENKASAKAFINGGYRLMGSREINGNFAMHFVLDR